VSQVRAVEGVSFELRQGETLGLVGGPDSGKTTLGRLILRIEEPTAGGVFFRQGGEMIDVLRLNARAVQALRREMQIILSNPFDSLNPRMNVFDLVAEPFQIHRRFRGEDLERHVNELVRRVGLRSEQMRNFPYVLNAGQRQRVNIARALALHPKLIICDEPAAALDPPAQGGIIRLLKDMQRSYRLSYLWMTRDLASARAVSDRLGILFRGRLVELAPTDQLIHTPRHPYTESLLATPGEAAPEAVESAAGCPYSAQCRYAQDVCRRIVPEWRRLETDHWVACHRAEELSLTGTD
jgi:oligopeptide/dipeptide ABC transporter ATP-binding protein